MTRQRLRPAYTAEELAAVYARPHEHRQWIDHQMRVAFTALLARGLDKGAVSGADLSCGDGALLRAMHLRTKHFGDFAPGWQYRGQIEETIEQIPPVDVFICTETLEHLDDPDLVLKKIRAKTQRLILSTPIGAYDDTNPEHYWAWSRADVEQMLTGAGFALHLYANLDLTACGPDAYSFGMWGCL